MTQHLGGRAARRKSVLYVGQSYYHAWYLSRELRKLGWRADVLNYDHVSANEAYYHGEDFAFRYQGAMDYARQLGFYVKALSRYDIFHFSNVHGLQFGPYLRSMFTVAHREGNDVRVLKALGKKIVYSNNGCLDGVAQSSFASWGDRPVCVDCSWRDRPEVCSDRGNLAWGKLRNELADYQCTSGGNRKDYNDDRMVHEVPQFACLDPEVWRPDLSVPERWRLDLPESTVRIYHGVGNFQARTSPEGRNLKSTHIYFPLIEKMKAEGYDVELTFVHDMSNRDVRFVQVQADIVVEMLTYGWFGANAREALMLGKPVVCYLRPEWLESMRREIPEYVDELPVVSATPETVEAVLKELVENPGLRGEVGERGRRFALKWHSAEAGARRMDAIYRDLLAA